jgi:hypothetical protein
MIEAGAAERDAREQADLEAKLAARAAKAAATGRKPGGTPFKAPTPGPRPHDQIHLADADSRIMSIAGGGFEQYSNAQAVVDTQTMLALPPQVMQAANDKQQLTPMLVQLQARPEAINQTEQLLADAGDFSDVSVTACESAGIKPAISIQRDEHHPPLVGAHHERRGPTRRGDPGATHGPPSADAPGPGDRCRA